EYSTDCGSFFLPAVVTDQVTFEQHPREVTVRAGSEVTFNCSIKGGHKNNYFMYWYRRAPRHTLEWIYDQHDKYGIGFKDRFKGRVESSRTTLQI
ncbi:HV01 protein, partial [Hippolais icterina]|nr:HV01 protein [Hippolais icterina]